MLGLFFRILEICHSKSTSVVVSCDLISLSHDPGTWLRQCPDSYIPLPGNGVEHIPPSYLLSERNQIQVAGYSYIRSLGVRVNHWFCGCLCHFQCAQHLTT